MAGGTPLSLTWKLCNQINKHAYLCIPKQMGNGKVYTMPFSGGAISQSSQCTVTAPGHPFVNGDTITAGLIFGMSQLNNPTTAYTVSDVVSGVTFKIKQGA